MADNVAITPGSGASIAADDVSSVYFQKIKVDGGGDGVSVPIVAGQQAMAASLPVVVASNQTAIPVSDGSSTLSIDDGGGSVTVDGTVAVSGTVTVDTELPSAGALADATANPTTPTVGAAHLLFNGTTWDRARGDTTNGLDVDVTRVSGTVTVDSELPSAGALADAAANPTTPTVGAANLLYNGTTWDRVRGDTTNGLDVDVTRLPSGTVAGGTSLPAGTNNIGDVDVLTQPARVATTDTITAKLATDAIQNGTTALTPKFAAIAAASSGDNTLVAAVVGKQIRVLQLFILVAGAVNVYFTSGAGGTVIFGGSTNKINLAANGGFVLPFSPVGWFQNSSANQALVMNLSGAVVVSGGLVYVEV